MTQNQLAYQANLEKERANRAQEEIGRRQASAAEQQARAKDLETQGKIADYESQAKRRKVQSGVDIANAVTGGLASVAKTVDTATKVALKFI